MQSPVHSFTILCSHQAIHTAHCTLCTQVSIAFAAVVVPAVSGPDSWQCVTEDHSSLHFNPFLLEVHNNAIRKWNMHVQDVLWCIIQSAYWELETDIYFGSAIILNSNVLFWKELQYSTFICQNNDCLCLVFLLCAGQVSCLILLLQLKYFSWYTKTFSWIS